MTYVYVDGSTANNKFYSTEIVQEAKKMSLHIDDGLLMDDIPLKKAIEPLVQLMPNILEKVALAQQNCKHPADDLSPDESAAIYLFTMRWEPYEECLYFLLNAALRDQNHAKLHLWKPYLKLLLTALDRLPSARITFHQDIELDQTRRFRTDNFLLFRDFTFCSLTTPLTQKTKQTTFYARTRTVFAFECRNAKFIERHSADHSTNEFLLLPTYFQFARYLDRRADLQLIQVKECLSLSPFHNFSDNAVPTNPKPKTAQTLEEMVPTASYRNPSLKRLIGLHQSQSAMNLTYQNLTVDDIPMIIELAVVDKQCTGLLLDNNYITFNCMSILVTALPNNSTLRELHLRETGLYDSSVKILAQTLALNNCSLQILGLNQNYITDEGAGYLAEMLKTNTSLTYLQLYSNPISKKGVHLLKSVIGEQNKTLKRLDISAKSSMKYSPVRTLLQILRCADL